MTFKVAFKVAVKEPRAGDTGSPDVGLARAERLRGCAHRATHSPAKRLPPETSQPHPTQAQTATDSPRGGHPTRSGSEGATYRFVARSEEGSEDNQDHPSTRKDDDSGDDEG